MMRTIRIIYKCNILFYIFIIENAMVLVTSIVTIITYLNIQRLCCTNLSLKAYSAR